MIKGGEEEKEEKKRQQMIYSDRFYFRGKGPLNHVRLTLCLVSDSGQPPSLPRCQAILASRGRRGEKQRRAFIRGTTVPWFKNANDPAASEAPSPPCPLLLFLFHVPWPLDPSITRHFPFRHFSFVFVCCMDRSLHSLQRQRQGQRQGQRQKQDAPHTPRQTN